MEMKHTPGPWVVRTSSTRFYIATALGDRPLNIASVVTDRLEQEANARLIAAAPELLEALDEAYGELLADSTRDGPRCLLLSKMESAIAKATGEA